MSKAFRNAGIGLAVITGVFTAYSSFVPEFEKQRDGGASETIKQQEEKGRDGVISEAILQDFKEARDEVDTNTKGGFAWGIRNAIFGRGKKETSPVEQTQAAQNNMQKPQEKLQSEQEK